MWTMCEDCGCKPCRCVEFQEAEQRAEIEEATRAASFAETELDYLWEAGPDGLLRRRNS